MKERLVYIDVLKVIALLCIVLAHVSPPSILFQLRNFDVVLMLLISSYLGLLTYKETSGSIYKQLSKRFVRLVIPTWIFVSIFFVINSIFSFKSFSLKEIIGTYALSDCSIGFVWVIRIYFIISLLVILYKYIIKHIKEKYMILVSVILFIIYEVLCHLGVFSNFYIQYLFAYIIPCFLLLCLSKYAFDGNKKEKIAIIIISLVTFLTSGFVLYKINGSVQPTQIMKYPFRSYYLSYGVLCSVLIIKVAQFKCIQKIINNKLTTFISHYSLWIYLWHILFYFIMNSLQVAWYLKYFMIIIPAFLVTYIQSIIIKKLESKTNNKVLALFKG